MEEPSRKEKERTESLAQNLSAKTLRTGTAALFSSEELLNLLVNLLLHSTESLRLPRLYDPKTRFNRQLREEFQVSQLAQIPLVPALLRPLLLLLSLQNFLRHRNLPTLRVYRGRTVERDLLVCQLRKVSLRMEVKSNSVLKIVTTSVES